MMPLMPLVPAPAREQAPILVVDDDPKILALVRTYLERERYRVVTAADGRSALAAIAEHPRLVVLDLMIPEIDGLEVIRRARQFGDVPILVLSARSAVGRPDPGAHRGRRRLPPQAVLARRSWWSGSGRSSGAPSAAARPTTSCWRWTASCSTSGGTS